MGPCVRRPPRTPRPLVSHGPRLRTGGSARRDPRTSAEKPARSRALLHAFARRLLGDGFEADDVVADTFVAAAEHLAELRDPAALRPWLLAICRRHVQRRWRARDRVRPTADVALVAAVAPVSGPAVDAGGAAEATELLWAAADGLGPADRELLALVLHSGLDSGEVARVAGDAPAATYVRISRLKEGLGRAAGALLVARHHRRDCADLDALLAAWDGAYSPLWRKRIARHVESCAACDRSRKAAATSLFSIAGAAPLVVLPLALRARVVAVAGEAASAVSSTPTAGGAMPAGTAPAAPPTTRVPPPTTAPPPPAPAPTVSLTLSEAAIATACGTPTTSQATATATRALTVSVAPC